MKNAFKLGFLALALSLSVVACSEKKADGADTTVVDSTVVDSSMKDSSAMDTSKMDTTKMDTTKKM
ncbi:hypothetical protein [Pedobacter sp. Leaf194]|uniref:hypothetical protein n=1 Tax=Pedobacter sp. Leaf194 TaxID=1736297 RepID=UPI000703AFDC|nr:hypothetical protein [Pedobacter sp. Leaf194]KQS34440.1 hypothetical protein ASG14_15060 [Pedobacter sp. Leaf194]